MIFISGMIWDVAKKDGPVHVERVVSRQKNKAGETREYVSHLVRRSYREDGKVKHETMANVSNLPPHAIDAIEKALAGRPLIDVEKDLEITRSLPHGNVAAVMAIARQLGFPAILGPAGRKRDLAMALVTARVVQPGSKLATAAGPRQIGDPPSIDDRLE